MFWSSRVWLLLHVGALAYCSVVRLQVIWFEEGALTTEGQLYCWLADDITKAACETAVTFPCHCILLRKSSGIAGHPLCHS